MTDGPGVGVALPTNRVRLPGPVLTGMARALEATPCRSVWVNDHLCAFPAGREHYPYSASGAIDWDPAQPQYEALATCAYVSAVTDRVRIGTAVLVLPQRHPVEVAKSVASIVDFSGGRFVLGVGAGWSRAEMGALGSDASNRGRRLDEQVAWLRALWGAGDPPAAAEHYRIPADVVMEPKPPAHQVPPVLVGGHSPAALARVRRLGDGWLAVSRPAPGDLRQAGRTLDRLRARSGRWLQGVVKVSLPSAAFEEAPLLMKELAAARWDEVCFEFDQWDTGEVCRLVERCTD